jgi:hypothetical protein
MGVKLLNRDHRVASPTPSGRRRAPRPTCSRRSPRRSGSGCGHT